VTTAAVYTAAQIGNLGASIFSVVGSGKAGDEGERGRRGTERMLSEMFESEMSDPLWSERLMTR
jgi:hypothetical protein